MVGACIGTDAHTVGIDAILNIKGFAGEKGLEYYREITVVTSARRSPCPSSWRGPATRGRRVLVSQVVTQRDAHLPTPARCRPRSARPTAGSRPLLVVGGPRFDEAKAADLGVDKVFGRGTTPGEVASYLVHASPAKEQPA